MNIIALASNVVALPCLQFLYASGMLRALVCPSRKDKEVAELLAWAVSQKINVVCVSNDDLTIKVEGLIHSTDAELGVVYSFPYKIPTALLRMPGKGFINFHFSKLPAYRGPSPIFWQIRNGERSTGITIHQLDAGWDTGPILGMLEIPIFPGETTGICTSRLAQLSVGVIKQFLSDNLKPSGSISETNRSYYGRPNIDDMYIDWETQSAETIENLVNACNYSGGGALTSYRAQPIQIIEVSPVEGLGNAGVKAGTVVHADSNGLFVQCSDRHLIRLNILKAREGVMSGFKMVAMGIQQGQRFEKPINQIYEIHR